MKVFIAVILFLLNSLFLKASQGLERIIVEKYYISDAKDEAGTGGKLKAGSVTYRIYADLLPRYRLQAVYGIPDHKLKIATTTYFYNDEDAGAVIANDIANNKLPEKAVMLDSWISVGAASNANYAVLKSNDSTNAIVNINGLLQNDDPSARPPLKLRDGMFEASPMSVPTLFSLDSTRIACFKSTNKDLKGQSLETDNGSWASFGGAIGPDSTNCVLIAQITTDGVLSFKLNIQLGTPFRHVENYVAENPKGGEFLLPDLTYPPIKK